MFAAELNGRIVEAALEAHPKELCALIVDGEFVVMENVAEDPLKSWKIDNADMLRATDGKTLQAVVHSHPSGKDHPTWADSENQIRHGVTWGITSWHEKMRTYMPPFFWGDAVPIAPLHGREFRYGVHDCYSLARDWYFLEHNIRLRNLARDEDWWTRAKGLNLFVDNFGSLGFDLVCEHPTREDFKKMRDGDGVIGRIVGEVSNHCGVYIGRGLVLHHLPGRLSKSEPIGPWFHRITHIFRHKDLTDA